MREDGSMRSATAARPGWIGAVFGAACLLMAGCSSDRSDEAVSMTPVYSIEGNAIELEHGILKGEDGTVSLLTSTSGDLDGDASVDKAAILVHNSRGSGVFYYLNVLLNDGNGALRLAGEAFLGDRIKLDFMEIYGAGSVSPLTGAPIPPDEHGQIVVAYYIHGRDQAYAENPGVYVTRHWKIEDGKLVLVEGYCKIQQKFKGSEYLNIT
jgi:hypothetical protein